LFQRLNVSRECASQWFQVSSCEIQRDQGCWPERIL